MEQTWGQGCAVERKALPVAGVEGEGDGDVVAVVPGDDAWLSVEDERRVGGVGEGARDDVAGAVGVVVVGLDVLDVVEEVGREDVEVVLVGFRWSVGIGGLDVRRRGGCGGCSRCRHRVRCVSTAR